MNDSIKKIFESKITHILSQLIFEELENEKANKATITKCQSNTDGSKVICFVTFYVYPEQSLFELKKTRTFLRKRLAAQLSKFKVPMIDFELDKQLDLLNEWNSKFEAIAKKDEEVRNLSKKNKTKSKPKAKVVKAKPKSKTTSKAKVAPKPKTKIVVKKKPVVKAKVVKKTKKK